MIDGAGIGSSMVCNKVKGVRAALCYDLKTILNSRQHNDANVLTLGASANPPEMVEEMVRTWLSTPFEGAGISGVWTRSSPVPEPGGSGAGMDEKKLVELVTKEVLSALGKKAGGAPAVPPAAAPAVDRELAALIDHTLLKPEATEAEVRKLCQEAGLQVLLRLREHQLGVEVPRPAPGLRREGLLRGGLSPGGHGVPLQGLRDREAIANGAGRDRHGGEHRRPEIEDLAWWRRTSGPWCRQPGTR